MINNHFADIILPLAVKGNFTYLIPVELTGAVSRGVRVLVQLGNRKLYSGIVSDIHNNPPEAGNVRPVLKVLDPVPVNNIMLKFWSWISDYYMCSPGEVMKAAMPSIFSLEGETKVPVTEKYRPKEESFIQLASALSDKELNEILDKLAKAPKQQELLISFLRLSGYSEGMDLIPVKKSLLLRDAGTPPGIAEILIKKGVFVQLAVNIGRLDNSIFPSEPLKTLSDAQSAAISLVHENFTRKDIVLLHGITSSGKTEIYIHLIREQLKKGKQVLYLLPEIGLTTQIIIRLKKHFGSVTGVYHSRFSDQEKAEIWNRVALDDQEKGYRLILGVRSSLFLPFSNLGLVIIDEEQDSSYKQHDPSPRYNARDCGIVLAGLHKAKTILGSASPSIESYHNALTGKYALVELKERFGAVKLPEIIIANSREAYRKKLMVSHFTPELLETIDEALAGNEQIILFQNRRGFSPYIECPECGWIPKCTQCAVNLTYHKGIGRMVCHYCGYSIPMPSGCGNCNSPGLATKGFGTEKIEDEIKIVFPAARVARMDHDTTKGKTSFDRLIRLFEERQIDIMIGTQMISKGLDFENLTVVGILNADNLLNFPDFRAHERSFQLMEQVSGRAGRRKKPGRVVIQTSDPANKIIRLVLQHDYRNMFRLQSEERKEFNYPPFCRMIKINIRHKDRSLLNNYADILGRELKSVFGKRVLGPEFPIISQIQLWYIKTILVKLERAKAIAESKQAILRAIGNLEKEKGASSLRISIDVDPY